MIVALGRRRRRRHRRLRGGDLPARHAVRAGSDDAARAGRLVRRRQDGHQPPARQEHDRRLLPAARGADRHRIACRRCPSAKLAAGLAEVIKYGAIRDAAFFAWLEGNVDALVARDPVALAHAIHDELPHQGRDRRARTSARKASARCSTSATRSATPSRTASATASGCTAKPSRRAWSSRRGCRSASARMPMDAAAERLRALLARAGLPTAAPALGFDRWKTLLARDKKVAAGTIRYVLLDAIGEAVIAAGIERRRAARSPALDAARKQKRRPAAAVLSWIATSGVQADHRCRRHQRRAARVHDRDVVRSGTVGPSRQSRDREALSGRGDRVGVIVAPGLGLWKNTL